jgi:hypothetical protein
VDRKSFGFLSPRGGFWCHVLIGDKVVTIVAEHDNRLLGMATGLAADSATHDELNPTMVAVFVDGASRSGSVSVTTMHALFKGEVERKMTSGSTGFLRCASRSLNSATVMLFGLPCEQRLPKSLPQLSIRSTAAQTR